MSQAQCKCGWQTEIHNDRKAAEVAADMHEMGKAHRRAYQHETSVFDVTR